MCEESDDPEVREGDDLLQGSGLNLRQQMFVIAITDVGSKTWGNQAASARAAGYSARRPELAWKYGSRLASLPKIKAAIQERLKQFRVSADEALAVMAGHLHRDLGPYLQRKMKPILNRAGEEIGGREYWDVNMAALKRDGKTYLIAGIRNGVHGTSFEFVDSQAAAEKILKAAGVYKQSIEHFGKDGEPIAVKIISGVSMGDL